MTDMRLRVKPAISHIFRMRLRRGGLIPLMLHLSACVDGPAVDLAPPYEPARFVVPDSWHGSSPFVEAKPSDGELRPDWWKLFNDPVLNRLEEQAMAANPDLQAAAERFVQARDMMMKVRSRLIPQFGLEFGASDNRQSINTLFRAPNAPIEQSDFYSGGLASWEPDFWSAIRNRVRAEIYQAEQRAAEYGLARLSLQAEIAANYFTLRGYDAQDSVYKQSIAYYKKSLEIVDAQYKGAIVPQLDVARAEYLLHSTEAKELDIQSRRQVTEHAIAILVNKAPAAFSIAPLDELPSPDFRIPQSIPATLLERRPDIAQIERQMAQANRAIGIARAAFFPNVVFKAGGGYENDSMNLIALANSYWSYGASIAIPLFQGGLRRAQLQQSWAAYRETEDKYRATVLNAFREVENGLSLTNRLSVAADRQDEAVKAALKTQNLTMELYLGGLISSLDLIYAQINTLTARIDAVVLKTERLKNTVALIRALGGGWNRKQLPADDQIQPFGVFEEYGSAGKPKPAGGIDVPAENNNLHNDLTRPFRQ
ncbi:MULTISPECIES: efflux transporter outer membrane subunit [Methylococcus]|uniref:Efflux transporter outer membrane subunit n=1 Tax=Methylococcus capsulatus TaxID=414 RepID=A0ABZ2F7X7_METCP|nr:MULTISPECIES: efflux transporter outer membrane subunit [Methylococcus]